ncbi:MAG: sulfotransferase [Planctomycetota bacterium]
MRFCIIFGAMKAGTTSLFNYLAQHPEIASCKEKEPSFFSHHYEKGIEFYIKLWKKGDISTKVLMEASVNYTKYPSFPDSSKNLLDFTQKHDVDVKFIYIMRNPINRLESQYTYSYARWTSDSLEQRIRHGHLIAVSRYAHQLDLYYDKFSHEKFLLLDFNDLIRKPDEVLKQVCEFLNIDAGFHFSGLDEIYNKSKGKTITRPVDRLYLKYPRLKSISKIFPKTLRQGIAKLLFRKKITRNFELTQAQRQCVYGALKDDMIQLRQKYGVDVSKWGF